uniref:Solute carrier family 16 member 12 n=1 Tax=Tetraodon nigroviridis TaxID=99883 RepID=H3C623_TETNG
PPEGGWGWMVVAACFLATICIRAVTRCVSVFFVEFQLHFEMDYSTTAWIHSITDATTMLCAPLGALLGDWLSCRVAIILGGLLSSAGLILSSCASSVEQLYICTGILTGLGFALSYTPAIAMVGIYFHKRKALAYGFAMSGSGIGTFILAPTVQMFIEYYSWRGALLLLGGLVSNLCVCGALMRPLQPRNAWSNKLTGTMLGEAKLREPRTAKNLDSAGAPSGPTKAASGCCFGLGAKRDFSFLLAPRFLVLSTSFCLMAYGCSTPVVHLVPYALSLGLEQQQAAFLMAAFGASGIAGNIASGWIMDRKYLTRYRMLGYMLALGMEGLCCLLAPLLHSFPLLLTFSVFYGVFDGAYVALIPVVTSDVVDPAHLTTALGVVYFLHAVPYLLSPPIGGWLVDRTGNYHATFLLSGVSFLLSAVVLTASGRLKRLQKSGSASADP